MINVKWQSNGELGGALKQRGLTFTVLLMSMRASRGLLFSQSGIPTDSAASAAYKSKCHSVVAGAHSVDKATQTLLANYYRWNI